MTAKAWNDLPPPTRSAININQFKSLAVTKVKTSPIYYTKCTGKEGSPLNYPLNLIIYKRPKGSEKGSYTSNSLALLYIKHQ